MLTRFATIALAVIGFSQFSIAATKYSLDSSHSTVGFNVTHLMISKVNGRFDKFEGDFSFDEKTGQLESLNAKIDVDTINTNDAKRDAHLKNDDFFGVRSKDNKIVEAKRWMTFKATAPAVVDVKKSKAGTIKGELTLNGITKPTTLNVVYKGAAKDPWGNQKLGFEATGKVNRKDFNIVWNKALETGGVVVGDEVEVVIQGEATATK